MKTKSQTILGIIKGSVCYSHKPKLLGYLQWQDFAEQKLQIGEKQKRCTKCGRWFFRDEF